MYNISPVINFHKEKIFTEALSFQLLLIPTRIDKLLKTPGHCLTKALTQNLYLCTKGSNMTKKVNYSKTI